MQRLERFSGLAILTTNLGANLDEAFTRRFAVSVDFPLPGADRLRLWERLLGRAPRDPALDPRLVAERVELAGDACCWPRPTASTEIASPRPASPRHAHAHAHAHAPTVYQAVGPSARTQVQPQGTVVMRPSLAGSAEAASARSGRG